MDRTLAVGRCVVYQQPAIAPSAEDGTVLSGEPLLDRTRSEAALPLRSRGHILGALSVQSAREAVFEEDDVAVLQAIADQLAVALDNARLFTQTGTALREVQAAQRRYLAEAWKEFLEIRPMAHVDYVQPGAELGDDELLRDAQRAAMVHERAVATDLARFFHPFYTPWCYTDQSTPYADTGAAQRRDLLLRKKECQVCLMVPNC